MAAKGVTIRVTRNFENNLETVREFLDAEHAGAAYLKLLDALFDRIIPLLQDHPRLGRDLLARAPQSVEVNQLHQRIAARLGEAGELREYLHGDYLMLYALLGQNLHLLALRHHRQLSFDLPGFWV